MASRSTSAAQSNVQKSLDKAVNAKDGPAGLVFASIDRKGNVLAAAAAGLKSLDNKNDPISLDTVFPLWSCTKMITGVACMQLVDQGLIKLDEPADKFLPELGQVKLIDGSSPKNKITLRHLLSHTAGFAYSMYSKELKEYTEKTGKSEFDGSVEGTFGLPLVAEPGTEWHYSISLDWAGRLLEAITGMTLGQYCLKNIFEPLGCKDIQFGAKAEHRSRFATLHSRATDGTISVPKAAGGRRSKSQFDSGGGGSTGTVGDYLKIANVLINEGVGANGSRILQAETVKLMLSDQLGDLPQKDPLDQPTPSFRPDLTPAAELMPGLKKGWGLSFLIVNEPLPTGRSAGSVWWAGLGNLYWMADPIKGVANIIASQSVPFNDMKVIKPWLECEGAVYATLNRPASKL